MHAEMADGTGGRSRAQEGGRSRSCTMERPAADEGAMERHRRQVRWTYAATVLLGAWLIANAFNFDHGSGALFWSDIISGVIVLLCGALAVRLRLDWLRWGVGFTGLWLLFAPLIFWAPEAVVFASDTLIGSLLISFSFLIPGMPGQTELPGTDVPPGWSYNPSSWGQRVPIIGLAMVGYFTAQYLASFQLGYIDQAWDPFFGKGTESILTSDVSRAWPISDAGLGAVSYLLDALAGAMGGRDRWRTLPWMVLLFGFLVIPPGVTSIILIMLQPIAVGAWCSVCIFTAMVMLAMIPMTFDEVIASWQYMGQATRAGMPFWRTLFLGGTIPEGAVTSELSAKAAARLEEKRKEKREAVITVPWTLFVSCIFGAWLMASPDILGTTGIAADNDHLVGPLIITVAVTAFAECLRPARFINIVFGLWLLTAPFLLTGFTVTGIINEVVVGLVVILLSFRKGGILERYGDWQKRIV